MRRPAILRRALWLAAPAVASAASPAVPAAALEPLSLSLGLLTGAGLAAAGWLAWRRRPPRGDSPAAPSTLDRAPLQVFELDLSAAQRRFAELRAAGVHDFVAYTRQHPEFGDACRAEVRVLSANRAALESAGCADLAAFGRFFGGPARDPYRAMFAYQLSSLWAARKLIEDEYPFADSAGIDRAWFMQCRMPEAAGDARVLVCVTDVSASRGAVAARIEDFSELREILAQANILLWGAKVRFENGRYEWKIHVPPHSVDSPLYRLATAIDKGGLWDHACTPDFEAMQATAENALRTGLPRYRHEFRLRNGERTHWIAEEVSVQRLDPETWALVGVVTDVSARRDAELARQASVAQLEQILTRADCLLWEATLERQPDGSVKWDMYVPQSILHDRLFGGHPGASRGLDWDGARVPERPAMHDRCWRALNDGSAGYDQEFRAFRGEQMFWLREQVSISRPAPGFWSLVGVVTDITARRAAEAALAAEKERLAVTLRAMEDSVVTTDTDGRVQFINRAALAFARVNESEAVGRPVAELLAFHTAGTGAALPLPLADVVGLGRLHDLPAQTALRDRAGLERLISGCCAPVRDAHSEIIGTVLVFRDITDRQRLAAELQQASKLESVGVLAGGIAHDFNNILTAILGNLSLAMLEAKGLTFIERSLQEAQKATTRARDLTQQLLTFSKGGAPVRTAVHLPGVVVEVTQFALHGTKAKAEYDLPTDLWPADADKGQVGQIVQNLVINASQAMPEGGVIRVVARNHTVGGPGPLLLEPGDYLKISVVDNGPGIPPEHLARVFDPYFTTKQSGSGLGLASVFSIVRRHKGHVEVESTPGVGATFHVWLPALREVVPTAAPAANRAMATLNGRVLFMDDEAPIREMAARLMSRFGLQVEVAADGDAAIRLFHEARAACRPFDLVIMDLTIPGGMGGREALGELRKIDPQIRAIVSSGYSGDPVMSNHRDFGFNGVVRKPYELHEFSSVLHTVLASRPETAA